MNAGESFVNKTAYHGLRVNLKELGYPHENVDLLTDDQLVALATLLAAEEEERKRQLVIAQCAAGFLRKRDF